MTEVKLRINACDSEEQESMYPVIQHREKERNRLAQVVFEYVVTSDSRARLSSPCYLLHYKLVFMDR